MKKILFVAVVLALFTTAASAQKGFDGRQRHRAHQGVHSGQLTRAERMRIQKNATHYHHAKRRAWSDGRLTSAERRRLNSIKRQDSRRIYAMKHNSRRRTY